MKSFLLYGLSMLLMFVLLIPCIVLLQYWGAPEGARSAFSFGFGMFVTLWIYDKLSR